MEILVEIRSIPERDWEEGGRVGGRVCGRGFNMNGVHVEAVRDRAKEVLRASAEACRCIISEVVLPHFALIPKWSWPTLL